MQAPTCPIISDLSVRLLKSFITSLWFRHNKWISPCTSDIVSARPAVNLAEFQEHCYGWCFAAAHYLARACMPCHDPIDPNPNPEPKSGLVYSFIKSQGFRQEITASGLHENN
jgi:hypothetical protein